MGLVEYLEGAPEPDPQFIRPPEEEEVYDAESLIEADRRNGRSLKLAIGAAGLVLVGSSVLAAITMNGYGSRVNADVQQSPSTYEASASMSPTSIPSPTESPSPTPSFSAVPQAATPSKRLIAHSPSHIPSPSITESRKVTLSPTPTPTPTPEASTQIPKVSCAPNENAPGEVVCSSPVKAYKDGVSDEVVFEITGGAAPNCANIQGNRVEVALANAVGFADLVELGNPCDDQ